MLRAEDRAKADVWGRQKPIDYVLEGGIHRCLIAHDADLAAPKTSRSEEDVGAKAHGSGWDRRHATPLSGSAKKISEGAKEVGSICR
jgi:hypothetical protein